jgi:hypothetical protein
MEEQRAKLAHGHAEPRIMISEIEVPFIWPEPTDPDSASRRLPAWVGIPIVDSDVSMLGIVWGLNSQGVEHLREQFDRKFAKMKAKLVVAVYAASPTTCRVLQDLLEVVGLTDGRLEVMLLAISLESNAAPMCALCFSEARSGRSQFWFGNSPNMGFAAAKEGHLNIGFEGDSAMFGRWLNWFGGMWSRSAPLTPLTANIPALVPARGTQEAADSWREYELLCRELGAPEMIVTSPEKTDEPEAQRLQQIEKQEQAVAEICKGMGIRPPDALQEKLARIVARGQIITVDKSGRTPPLELPVRAEWLGLESSRTVGMISRETRYRIKIFDEQKNKELEAKRGGVSELIKRLSFPIADGVRWIPISAQPLLEAERERLEGEARALINSLVGSSASEFAASRKHAIEKDATEMYREVQPEAAGLPQSTLSLILRELESRLGQATQGDFLPKVSYAGIQFATKPDSEHTAAWAQGRTLLAAMAEYFRRAMTERSHLRGHQIPEEDLLKALDACEDWILSQRQNLRIRQLAKRELLELDEIVSGESDDRAKCESILALIKHLP